MVRSRHPGRYPKLEGATLSYPAFEPLTDPVGNVTTWVRDNLNRVTQETNQLGASRLFAYDAAGNVVQETDRNGRVSEFAYDNLYRPTQERWLAAAGGAVIYTANFGYNAASELERISKPSFPRRRESISDRFPPTRE